MTPPGKNWVWQQRLPHPCTAPTPGSPTTGSSPARVRPLRLPLGERAPGHRLVPLPGDALYNRIRAAHTVVATSEPSLYGNMIIRKGVIYPERDGAK